MVRKVEVDLDDIGEQLARFEPVLFAVFDGEVLVPRTGERVEVVVEHGGEPVNDLGFHEGRFGLGGEDLEEVDCGPTECGVPGCMPLE